MNIYVVFGLSTSALLFYAGVWGFKSYGMYTILKIIVFVFSLLSAFESSRLGKSNWSIFCWAVAIIFNPIINIRLGRSVWGYIDLFVGFVFVVKIFLSKNATKESAKPAVKTATNVEVQGVAETQDRVQELELEIIRLKGQISAKNKKIAEISIYEESATELSEAFVEYHIKKISSINVEAFFAGNVKSGNICYSISSEQLWIHEVGANTYVSYFDSILVGEKDSEAELAGKLRYAYAHINYANRQSLLKKYRGDS